MKGIAVDSWKQGVFTFCLMFPCGDIMLNYLLGRSTQPAQPLPSSQQIEYENFVQKANSFNNKTDEIISQFVKSYPSFVMAMANRTAMY